MMKNKNETIIIHIKIVCFFLINLLIIFLLSKKMKKIKKSSNLVLKDMNKKFLI